MRGVHMTGNGTVNAARAMREAVNPPPFYTGGALTFGSATMSISRSSFVDSNGVLQTNDTANVRLTNVTLHNGTFLPLAGFSVYRSLDGQNRGLQFSPSFDTSLRGVSGFGANVTISLQPDDSLGFPADSGATGNAMQFMADLIQSGPEVVLAAALTSQPPAALTRPQVADVLERIRASARKGLNFQLNSLRELNAGWIGITASMFVSSISDPIVRLRYRPAGQTTNDYATFDDADLLAFIQLAKQQGVKVYLTLALDAVDGPKSILILPSDPRCNTADAPIDRWHMGRPDQPPTNIFNSWCLSAAHYWWAPSHPEHTTKRAAFWRSYTDIAVKYARMSQQAGVDLYSLGTETEYLFRARSTPNTGNDFGVELRQMMTEVRAAYSGRVTYDQHISVHTRPQNFGGAGWAPFLAQDLGFDAIGLSAYIDSFAQPPTSLLSVATFEQQFWTPVFEALKPLKAANPTRPIIFTEFGVVASLGSPYNQAYDIGTPVTGRDAQGNTDGMRQQARMYESFFNVNERYSRLVTGVFFWARNFISADYMNANYCFLVGHELRCSPPASAAVANGYDNWRRTDIDRVFNWAQQVYPQYFPTGATTGTGEGYIYRFYPSTGNYLGYKDDRVIIHNGIDWFLIDVGPLGSFLDLAVAAGY